MNSIDERIRPQIVDRQVSADGARKYAMRLVDGNLVETVGLPHGDPDSPCRLTVCFSSQAGCGMKCTFCATGRQGLARNLKADEIVGQVILVGDDFGCNVDTAIAMGQGEPLANYAELANAIGTTGHPKSLNARTNEVIISTCGLPAGIRSLASDRVPATLAVSLHAAKQDLRDKLMPGVRHYPIALLHSELACYNENTGKRVIVQYLMLNGVNDGDEDLEALAAFCQGLNAHVSLLQYNAIEDAPFSPSPFGKLALWYLALNQQGIKTSINHPRGADIDAACGQLANHVS